MLLEAAASIIAPSQEAIPMISKLRFDPQFRPAMVTLFGHTLVCRDFEKASEFAQSARMDCITMEGALIYLPSV